MDKPLNVQGLCSATPLAVADDKGGYKALKSIEKTRLFLNFKNGRASRW